MGTGTTGPEVPAADTTATGRDAADSAGVPDLGDPSGAGGECILWADECAPGQKCMPWSLDADQIPDEIRCCAGSGGVNQPGDPCLAMDYNGSCVDDCATGSMCLLDDIEGLAGECRKFCDPANPVCGPDQTCKGFFELLPGVPTVPLCMDECHPLIQDCAQPGWRCIPDTPTLAGQSGFICVTPPPGQPVGLLGACALANQCDEGLVCVSGSRLPDCDFTSCCTSYCSLAEGNGPCNDLAPDLRCVDWMSPSPRWSDVGVCALPQ